MRDGFLLLAAALALGLLAPTASVTSLENTLVAHVQRVRIGWLVTLLRLVNALVSPPAVALVTLATAVVVMRLLAHRRELAGTAVVMLGGWLVSLVLNPLFNRPAPSPAPWLPHPGGLAGPAGAGYPSLPVAFTAGVALAGYLAARRTRYRAQAIAAGVVAVSLAGAAGLYLGLQYPTDLLGGVLVSGAVAAFVESFRARRTLDDLPGWSRQHRRRYSRYR